ncbi:MAG: type II toxin-antitoxin system VapC family toxin [Planctomycetota bacterium]
MTRVLLDTCIFSFTFKGDQRAKPFLEALKNKTGCLCFMSIAELYRWALARNWGPKKIAELEAKIAECVLFSYDDGLGWEWARLMTIPGRPMPSADAWIAACALRHNLPLVTANRKDFEHIPGLVLIPNQ